MSDIEQQIKDAAEKAVLKFIASSGWLETNYNDRVKVPADLLRAAWELVDRDKLKIQLAERIERELADRLINHIATEMASDIKQILSVAERREAVRALAREHMNAIMAKGSNL